MRISDKVLAVFCLLATQTTVWANELGGASSWQFQTTTDRANKTNVATQISKEQAGSNSPVTSTTNIIYDVAGNINNCNLNATSIGNTGTNSLDAPMGSPLVDLASDVNSGATGNTSDAAQTGGSSSTSTSNGGMVDSAVGVGDNIDQTSDNSSAINSTQTSTGSQLSTVGSVVNDYGVAGVVGTGGDGQASLNSTQTVSDSPQNTSVVDSNACDFQQISGNLSSPVNDITTTGYQLTLPGSELVSQ